MLLQRVRRGFAGRGGRAFRRVRRRGARISLFFCGMRSGIHKQYVRRIGQCPVNRLPAVVGERGRVPPGFQAVAERSPALAVPFDDKDAAGGLRRRWNGAVVPVLGFVAGRASACFLLIETPGLFAPWFNTALIVILPQGAGHCQQLLYSQPPAIPQGFSRRAALRLWRPRGPGRAGSCAIFHP